MKAEVRGQKAQKLIRKTFCLVLMVVQSFIESEVLATQRRQTTVQVEAALERIKEARFPTLNIDLIYGLPGQNVDTWLQSIHTALQFQPEEIYLYPLYVRPLTGLGRTDKEWDDIRLACYREGRSLLLSSGYTQAAILLKNRLEIFITLTGQKLCSIDLVQIKHVTENQRRNITISRSKRNIKTKNP